MKRSGMQLRSTTRVAPELTKYSSPFHQEDDAIIEANIGGDPEITPNTNLNEGGRTFRKCCPRYSKTPYTSTVEGCNGYQCKFADEGDYDPCASKAPCADGKQKQVSADGKSCNCVGTGESTTIDASESLEVNEPGTSMRPLTNREVRMNMRMINRGAAREGKLVAAANRRIRKAIRRGTPINPSDEAIVSGQALGQLDPNFNPYLHTSGSKSIYTGMQRGAQNFESGGRDENYNAQVQSAADKMMAEKGYKKNADGKYDFGNMSQEEGQKILDQTISDAKASVDTSLGSGSGRNIYAGQFLNDRTKRLARRKGFQSGGSLGNLASQNDQLKAQRLQNKLDTNTEMSDKRRARIQKRIKKKGGTKKTPVKMSIELTRPSYKMKGFGK